MKKLFLLLMAVACLGLAGCFHAPTFTVNTSKSTYNDDTVFVSIEPIQEGYFYKSFLLEITNKTEEALKLSWDNSYFIDNGEAKGSFMFEGVMYIKRDEPKQDLLILPKSFVSKYIYPTINVMSYAGSWFHKKLNGECGVYLNITGENYKKNIELLVTITEVPETK